MSTYDDINLICCDTMFFFSSRACTMCILWLGIGMNGDCVTLHVTSDMVSVKCDVSVHNVFELHAFLHYI